MDRKIHWRCFHCGEAFTKAQERWAREHFGANEDAPPVCQMRVPGEHHLLTILRKTQAELDAYRAEDTDLWRALYAQAADHAAALRREEERGYEKGLADGRARSSEVQPVGSERSDEGNLPPDDPLDTSRHVDGAVCPDCGLDWCGVTCGRWPKGSVDA